VPSPQEELLQLNPHTIALDVEGDSYYRYGERLCLVQVAFSGVIRVLDPLALDLSEFFAQLAERKLVLHGADFDLRLLHARYGFSPEHVFDTMLAARFLNLEKFGLSDLYERYFGFALDKKHQRADWCQRPLSAELLEYARKDVAHLEELGAILGAELEVLGRLDWHREECALVVAKTIRALRRPPDPEAWRIKGAGSLSRRGLAFLRELAAARERLARERDRALFRIFSSEDLLLLARLAAEDPGTAVRRFPRSLPTGLGREFSEAIGRASQLPESEYPLPPQRGKRPDPGLERRVRRLLERRDALARNLNLDPGFLVSRPHLARIAEASPANEQQLAALLDSTWRTAVLKDAFLGA
jgi:ribonuclease D